MPDIYKFCIVMFEPKFKWSNSGIVSGAYPAPLLFKEGQGRLDYGSSSFPD